MFRCQKCDKEVSKKQAMRSHLIASSSHNYDEEELESYRVEDQESEQETEEIEEIEEESEVESISQKEKDHQLNDGSSSSNSDTISFSDVLSEDQGSEEEGDSVKTEDQESEDSEQETEGGRGISESINQAYGTLFTWDLEDGQERTKTKRRLKELADDLQLGENAFRTYEKFMESQEEIPPEKALMGSALACIVFGFIQRPELFERLKDKISEFGGDQE